MVAEISSITYFAPIAAFLIVFVIAYAILSKIEILGDNKWVNLFISLFIATLFVSMAGAREYIQTVVPWFAVLLVSLVFILVLTGVVGKDAEFMKKGIGIAFVIALGLVFG